MWRGRGVPPAGPASQAGSWQSPQLARAQHYCRACRGHSHQAHLFASGLLAPPRAHLDPDPRRKVRSSGRLGPPDPLALLRAPAARVLVSVSSALARTGLEAVFGTWALESPRGSSMWREPSAGFLSASFRTTSARCELHASFRTVLSMPTEAALMEGVCLCLHVSLSQSNPISTLL